MAENITIQFKATGGPALKKTIDTIWAANERLTKGQTAYVKAIEAVKQSDIAAINAKKKLAKAEKQMQDEVIQSNLLYYKRKRALDGANVSKLNLTKSTHKLTRAQKQEQDIIIQSNLLYYKNKKAQDDVNNSSLFGARATRNLSDKFSVLRSQMLLASFGYAVLIEGVKKFVDAHVAAEKALLKINAILKSTSYAAGQTSAQLNLVANSITSNYGIAKTEVQEMQARLLTFTNISGKQINEFTKAALDLSAVFGQDLNQSTIQLGKALNDPIKGYTALRRIGVSFTESQVDQIKTLQESGDVVGAQNVILKELNREMGGAGVAAAQTSVYQKAQNELMKTQSELWESIGDNLEPLIPAFTYLINIFLKLVKVVTEPLKLISSLARALNGSKEAAIEAAESFTYLTHIFPTVGKVVDKTIGSWARSQRQLQEQEEKITAVNTQLQDYSKTLKTTNKEVVNAAKQSQQWTKETDLQAIKLKLIDAIQKGYNGSARKLTEQYTKALTNNKFALETSSKEQKKIKEAVDKNVKSLNKKLNILKANTKAEKAAAEAGRKLTQEEIDLANAIEQVEERIKEEKASLVSNLEAKIQQVKMSQEIIKLRKGESQASSEANMIRIMEMQMGIKKGYDLTEQEKELISSYIREKVVQQELIESYKGKERQLKLVQKSKENLLDIDRAVASIEKEILILEAKNEGASKSKIKRLENEASAEAILRKAYDEQIKIYDELVNSGASLSKTVDAEIGMSFEELSKLIESSDYHFSNAIDNFTHLNNRGEDMGGLSAADEKMLDLIQTLRKLRQEQDELNNSFYDSGASLNRMAGHLAGLGSTLSGFSTTISDLGSVFTDTLSSALDDNAEKLDAQKEAFTALSMAVLSAGITALQQQQEQRIAMLQEQGQAEMDALKSSRRYDKLSAAQKKRAEENITKEQNKALQKAFKRQQQARAAGVLMDTAAAIMGIWADFPKADFGATAAIFTGLVSVLGAAQLAEIDKQKPPTMAAGGYVGGLPHSQGGTMINAERGEFVMSRAAVDSVGLDTMNRINQGGLGGNPVNVSFSGNINSDDFIESEAIPKIKDAIRRGADIGVG